VVSPAGDAGGHSSPEHPAGSNDRSCLATTVPQQQCRSDTTAYGYGFAPSTTSAAGCAQWRTAMPPAHSHCPCPMTSTNSACTHTPHSTDALPASAVRHQAQCPVPSPAAIDCWICHQDLHCHCTEMCGLPWETQHGGHLTRDGMEQLPTPGTPVLKRVTGHGRAAAPNPMPPVVNQFTGCGGWQPPTLSPTPCTPTPQGTGTGSQGTVGCSTQPHALPFEKGSQGTVGCSPQPSHQRHTHPHHPHHQQHPPVHPPQASSTRPPPSPHRQQQAEEKASQQACGVEEAKGHPH
jgi:hypothetical protein